MSEKAIADEIAKLRLQDAGLETRRLLDQAEQLLSLGRQIEGGALVEKAEALARDVARANASSQPTTAEGSD